MNTPDQIRLDSIIKTLWSRRKRIVAITIVFMIVSLVYALMLPNMYSAAVTLLPESEEKGLSQFAQLSTLMSLPGLPVSPVSETELYPELMKSEAILKDVIYREFETAGFDEPVNLIDYWDIGGNTERRQYQATLQKLRDEALKISIARDSRVITLGVETTDPDLSADIANSIVDNLGQYVLNQRRTRASQQRQWIEKRLEEVQLDLRDAEDALKNFREANRRILDSPELMMQQERYLRDLEKNATIYLELSKQYEMIRVQEIRDMPVVQVLDPASPPAKKSGPGRKRILILGTLFGLLTGVLTVYGNRLLNISGEESAKPAGDISGDPKKEIPKQSGGPKR
jgi:uncharacterized protein involved in exopolysaccharide biosynthesis